MRPTQRLMIVVKSVVGSHLDGITLRERGLGAEYFSNGSNDCRISGFFGNKFHKEPARKNLKTST